jgi:serine/threonine-protein kinase
VFALGVTLHVLLTNLDVASKPWNYPPVRTLNPAVSKRLEQAILRATELEPDKRYQSIGELRAALLRCRNGSRIAASLPTSGSLAGERA